MRKVLGRSFFNRPTVTVARELIGKYLVRRVGRKTFELSINEVEVYDGFSDKASHASRGKTKRNQVMFGNPGHWYVYLCYGMYWMLNIVTRESGYPAAILIRGSGEVVGPGRLTKHLKINGKQNGLAASRSAGLWIEDRESRLSPKNIKSTGRVGVSYAGPVWSKKRWRFVKHP